MCPSATDRTPTVQISQLATTIAAFALLVGGVQPGVAPPPVPTAVDGLATLPVKPRLPIADYDRDRFFGEDWIDTDRNGCRQRDDVLRRDLTAVVLRANGCDVASGTLNDPYTATVIAFRRGVDTSREVEIDHVVALGNAWQTGAQQLTQPEREALANDLLNLQATGRETNQTKGGYDAAGWLPSNAAYQCAYVARQVAVKVRYRLWVTAAERDKIAAVLATCPGQPLPQ